MSNINDKAPTGATHCYFHGSDADWYCYTDRGLYRWCQGSWCASVHKTIEELASSCPLGRLEAIPAEPAQPVEDDLTWLARNVHGWHDNGDLVAYKWCGYAHFIFQNQPTPSGCETFTKAQWLTRRAELQNKPSWGAVPSHANWLAQDAAGSWLWHSSEPECRNGGWIGSTTRGYAAKGCVLGDWRDTLERRPVSATESPVDAAIKNIAGSDITSMPIAEWAERMRLSGIEKKAQEAEDLALRVSSMLREDPGMFSANELADLHQFCDTELTKRDAAVCGGQKYLDAHWFERGELPPVGVECEYVSPMSGEVKAAFIVAKHHFSEQVIWSTRQSGGELFYGQKGCFRPIRTERDVLLSVIVEEMNHYDTDGKLADAILAAGFKRGEA